MIEGLPKDLKSERGIIATLAMGSVDSNAWDIASGLDESQFNDDEAKRIFKKMKSLKAKGRDWLPSDFIITDDSGLPIMPNTSFELEELVKRVATAAFCRESILHGTKIIKYANAGDTENLRSVMRADYPLMAGQEDGRAPVTWRDVDAVLNDVTWLWDQWLPSGMLSIVVGAVEQGKSAFSLALARCLTAGTVWPSGEFPGKTGKVVWLSTEADEAINIKERAPQFGIDLDDILAPSINHEILSEVSLLQPAGWEAFEVAVKRPGVMLAVIDSLGGSAMDENDSRVKMLCKRIAVLARDTDISILAVHHPRKLRIGENDEITLDRVRGHSGIIQFARSIIAIEKPDVYSDVRRIKSIKNNLARKPDSLGFEWVDDNIVWTEAPVEVKPETQYDKAVDLLKTVLQNGRVPSTEIYEEAAGAGISKATIRRAMKSLNIVCRKDSERWYWSFPAPYIPEV